MALISDVFSLPVNFEFFAIFSYCLHFAKIVCLLKRMQRFKVPTQHYPLCRVRYLLSSYQYFLSGSGLNMISGSGLGRIRAGQNCPLKKEKRKTFMFAGPERQLKSQKAYRYITVFVIFLQILSQKILVQIRIQQSTWIRIK